MPYKDPEKQRAFQREWKSKTKDWFREYKSKLSCEKCGVSHPAVIQFHHHNDDKDKDVSRMVTQNLNRQTILDEIAKCQVLCANCHAIHHYEEGYAGGRPKKNTGV